MTGIVIREGRIRGAFAIRPANTQLKNIAI